MNGCTPFKVVVSFSSKSEEEYERTRSPVSSSEFDSMLGHVERVPPSTSRTYHAQNRKHFSKWPIVQERRDFVKVFLETNVILLQKKCVTRLVLQRKTYLSVKNICINFD